MCTDSYALATSPEEKKTRYKKQAKKRICCAKSHKKLAEAETATDKAIKEEIKRFDEELKRRSGRGLAEKPLKKPEETKVGFNLEALEKARADQEKAKKAK